MRLRYLCILMLVWLISPVYGQKKITLEDCFQYFRFYPAQVEGFAFTQDGRRYTVLEGSALRLRDIESAQFDSLLCTLPSNFQAVDYRLSSNEKTALFIADKQSVYRHSYLAKYLAVDLATGIKQPIGNGPGPLQFCELSPDGKRAAYVSSNNLYVQTLFATQNNIRQITSDGSAGQVIHGLPDWVYEEEFSSVHGSGMKALAWSADSKQLAWLRFDESRVPEFSMTRYDGEMYPNEVSFKYPKVGERNSVVTVHLVQLDKPAEVKEIQINQGNVEYVPRIGFTPQNALWFMTLNRHQDSLSLWIKPTDQTEAKVLLLETDSAYVDMEIADYLTFLKNGKEFIWGSERDNTTQLYLYDMDGKLVRPLTSGRESVTNFYGVDEKRRLLYFQTSYAPVMRMVWEIPMDGGDMRILSAESEGYHEATFSPTFDYWVHIDQDKNRVPVHQMRRRDGSIVRVLQDNAEVAARRKEYGFTDKELFQIPINKQYRMNCWLFKPADFDETKKYPVLIDIYGGPGSQTVTFAYDGYLDPWRQMLTQKGYIVVQVDNRGTGGLTRDFKKATQMQLGKLETEDQILAAKYIGLLPWVDRDRIGIWGWSYGGFLSTNAMFKGNGLYKAAVAVAPVTNWKWYDSVYTERYLHTYAENPKGYDDNSPIYFADKLQGKYLLCHGMMDDNVHWQHSVALIDALIKAGKQFETAQYPNRNHGIYGDGATMHLFTRITNFILENL